MNSIIRLIRTHKLSLTAIAFGLFYAFLVTAMYDLRAGDFQAFFQEPVNPWFWIERWGNWSSRLFIEQAVLLSAKNIYLWQALTMIFGAILFWSVARLARVRESWQLVVLFSLFLLINSGLLASAGIVATTVNYLWPVACLAWVVAQFEYPPESRRLALVSRFVSIILLIFAVCNEQVALIAVILALARVAYLLYNRLAIPKILWTYLVIAILGVANVLLSPGNDARFASDMASWWPGFDQVSLIYKLTLGTVVTFSRLLLAPEMMILLFITTLLVYSYKVKNRRAFISLLPGVALLVGFMLPGSDINTGEMMTRNILNELRTIALGLDSAHLVSSSMLLSYLGLYSVIVAGILSSVFLLYGKTKRTYYTLVAIGAGLAASLAISLSPSMFASTTRTLYPLVTILLIVNARTIMEVLDLSFSKK